MQHCLSCVVWEARIGSVLAQELDDVFDVCAITGCVERHYIEQGCASFFILDIDGARIVG
jgi:hypothetical protein